MAPTDICGEEGCNRKFHHACQCEWEYLQYKLDYPNGDPSMCSYDSEGKKRCIHHHPHHEIALASTTSADGAGVNRKESPPKKALKLSKEDKVKKKEQMLNWARGMTLENVVLNSAGDDVDSLGPKKWCELSAEVKKEFLKKNKIQLSQSFRNAPDLGKNVANHMKAASFKDLIKAPLKSKSPTTKPSCITEDGTLFRIINTIIRNKECYIETKNAHDKEDQDSRDPKSSAWQIMCEDYNSSNESLDQLSPIGQRAMVGYSISSDICKQHDKLTYGEFQECVLYLNAQYRIVRNAEKASGNHAHIGTYIGGKIYILYFDECLKETGDKALYCCAYPELDGSIRRSSGEAFKPKLKSRRSSGGASDRSYSPIPDGTNFRSKKLSAMDATEEAAGAIAERQYEMRHNDKFDRMMKMREQGVMTEEKVSRCKEKYNNAKRKGASMQTLEKIKQQYKHHKKTHMMYTTEYEQLKKEIGYTSPQCDDSLSIEDDNSSDLE